MSPTFHRLFLACSTAFQRCLTQRALDRFFEATGLAFQIIDDVLNLRGLIKEGTDVSQALKVVGEDIMEGKVTAPIAKAMVLMKTEAERKVNIRTHARNRRRRRGRRRGRTNVVARSAQQGRHDKTSPLKHSSCTPRALHFNR